MLALVAVSAWTVRALAAPTGGGSSIASAPTIPLGQQQVNAVNAIDFWRVPLKGGDQLTLRYGGQTHEANVEVCVLTPDVSDLTVGNQPCYAHKSVYGFSSPDSLTMSPRTPGTWTIAVVPYPGCENNGILDLRCKTGLQYYLTAFVKHPTKMTLTGPNLARRRVAFIVHGRLTGVRGSVLLESSPDHGAHWSTIAVKRTTSTGAFSQRLRFRSAGTVMIRASYPEAPSYVASSATVSVRVA